MADQQRLDRLARQMGYHDFATYQAYQAKQQAMRMNNGIQRTGAAQGRQPHLRIGCKTSSSTFRCTRGVFARLRQSEIKRSGAITVLTDKEIFDAIRERKGALPKRKSISSTRSFTRPKPLPARRGIAKSSKRN
jgi:hypothetical protein